MYLFSFWLAGRREYLGFFLYLWLESKVIVCNLLELYDDDDDEGRDLLLKQTGIVSTASSIRIRQGWPNVAPLDSIPWLTSVRSGANFL